MEFEDSIVRYCDDSRSTERIHMDLLPENDNLDMIKDMNHQTKNDKMSYDTPSGSVIQISHAIMKNSDMVVDVTTDEITFDLLYAKTVPEELLAEQNHIALGNFAIKYLLCTRNFSMINDRLLFHFQFCLIFSNRSRTRA